MSPPKVIETARLQLTPPVPEDCESKVIDEEKRLIMSA